MPSRLVDADPIGVTVYASPDPRKGQV